jgi:hypothetical protein
MKKWLIFAVIAAMFLVMFPACGGDDESGPSVDSVVATPNDLDDPTEVLITWTGGFGYEYGVYFQIINSLTSITSTTYLGLGQNLYSYELNDSDTYDKVLNTENQDQWAYLLNDASIGDLTLYDGTAVIDDFSDLVTFATGQNTEGVVRFGIAPANPGGFPLPDQITIKWDENYIKLSPAVAP